MNESHLFHCEACRADWRLRRAASMYPGEAGFKNEPAVEEHFVERVLAAVREERRRRMARFTGLAAAAALLFFFFAGAGREVAATSAATVEQAYAQLDVTSDLDGLLPD
jgi:predicted anti-sigma-YlaC factor YlaD